MEIHKLDDEDWELIAAASAVLEKNFHPERHTIGSAILCSSGKIYAAVNVESCGYGPCAEPIAVGGAISNGERDFLCIVAVSNRQPPHKIISPCGNCRQLLFDYAPDCRVIIEQSAGPIKVKARDLLPFPYSLF